MTSEDAHQDVFMYSLIRGVPETGRHISLQNKVCVDSTTPVVHVLNPAHPPCGRSMTTDVGEEEEKISRTNLYQSFGTR